MTYDYDDFYAENAPCSKDSSPRLRWLKNALGVALQQKMILWIVLCSSAMVIAFATGCTNKKIVAHESAVLRVAPDVRGYAYLWDAETNAWKMSSKMITYPQGWYLVPPAYIEEEEPLGGATGATMPNLGASR